MTPLRIDFIADVVCPWCWLGWIRLHKALALRPAVRPSVFWRAYQLDPTVPESGRDRAAYMAAKFPDPARRTAMAEVLTAAAAEDGVALNLNRITRSPNTAAAHRVIRWAQGQGRGPAAIEAAFGAYFTEGRDLGDPETLADVGAAAGLDRLLVLELLSEGVDDGAVRREHAAAVNGGVTGVPFIIFGGRVAVAGADSPERLALAVDRALAPA